MSRRAVLAICLTLSAAPLAAQRRDRCRDQWGDDDRANVCHTLGLGAKSTGSLRIDPGVNGGAEVTAWDGDSVSVDAYVHSWARSDSDAETLNRGVKVTLRGGVLGAEGPATERGNTGWAVLFVVRVPRGQDLDIEATNGPVSVRGVKGTLQLETTNGPVTLDGVSGDVHARLQNGPLSISLTGTSWDGAGLDARTVNGPLTIDIPAGYNATLETGTQNGPFHTDIPITVQGNMGRIGQQITTTLGRGGVTLRAKTTNGPLTIRSRP